MTRVLGLLLAAGGGRRLGGPKALVTGPDGVVWVVRASRVLRDGGCDPVVVVLGAGADRARELLVGEDVHVVEAAHWSDGMGASLRAGLAEAEPHDADAVLVHLVDLPDVGPEVVRRMLALAAPDVLARAGYGEGAGHPVLVGREHRAGVAAAASGDRGARDYLAARVVTVVDCRDLATGIDVDEPGPMLGR